VRLHKCVSVDSQGGRLRMTVFLDVVGGSCCQAFGKIKNIKKKIKCIKNKKMIIQQTQRPSTCAFAQMWVCGLPRWPTSEALISRRSRWKLLPSVLAYTKDVRISKNLPLMCKYLLMGGPKSVKKGPFWGVRELWDK
jgi:hypothetical protein